MKTFKEYLIEQDLVYRLKIIDELINMHGLNDLKQGRRILQKWVKDNPDSEAMKYLDNVHDAEIPMGDDVVTVFYGKLPDELKRRVFASDQIKGQETLDLDGDE